MRKHFVHTLSCFFFPRPSKNETVSHSVSAWYIGRVEALSGPRDIAKASAGIFPTFFTDPWVIQSSSVGRVLATEIASTTISVMLLLILIRRCLLEAASAALR